MKKITLTQGKFALVDDEDFEEIGKYKWYIETGANTFYAARTIITKNGSKHKIFMHRSIMNTPKNLMTDHIDGNGLNNQRSNLRLCTNSQNQANSIIRKNNTTGYKGVCLKKGKYTATISINRKRVHLGVFKTKLEAHEAYVEASKKYHKEFSRVV